MVNETIHGLLGSMLLHVFIGILICDRPFLDRPLMDRHIDLHNNAVRSDANKISV